MTDQEQQPSPPPKPEPKPEPPAKIKPDRMIEIRHDEPIDGIRMIDQPGTNFDKGE